MQVQCSADRKKKNSAAVRRPPEETYPLRRQANLAAGCFFSVDALTLLGTSGFLTRTQPLWRVKMTSGEVSVVGGSGAGQGVGGLFPNRCC